jgi:hypothetical protein
MESPRGVRRQLTRKPTKLSHISPSTYRNTQSAARSNRSRLRAADRLVYVEQDANVIFRTSAAAVVAVSAIRSIRDPFLTCPSKTASQPPTT